jgi:hypothetical protein
MFSNWGPGKSTAVVVLLLLGFGLAALADQPIPERYAKAKEFMDYLKTTCEPSSAGYDQSKCGKWDIEKVMSNISKNGLVVYDVNTHKTLKFNLKKLRKQLAARTGEAFGALAHFSYIYGQPYPQYSNISYVTSDTGIVISITGGYKLTFPFEQDVLKLAKIEYLQEEGD